MAADRERDGSLRNREEDHGGEFVVESGEIRGVERAKSLEIKPPTQNAIQKSFLSFSETELQLLKKKAQKKVQNIISLVSGASMDAGGAFSAVEES